MNTSTTTINLIAETERLLSNLRRDPRCFDAPDGRLQRIIASAKRRLFRLRFSTIRPGDSVTIMVYAGMGREGAEWKQKSGRAVFYGDHGWVLDMGGRYGTPGIATLTNTVSIRRRSADGRTMVAAC